MHDSSADDRTIDLEEFRAGSFRRMTLRYRTFVCQGPDHHEFRCGVRREGGVSEEGRYGGVFYQPLGGTDSRWLPIALCPHCTFMAGEKEEYLFFRNAQVGESERFVAFLSPDGQRLAVPGKNSGAGFERSQARRIAQGYQRVEGYHFRDLDKFDAVRSQQTGRECHNEMNYDPGTRREREEADPESDD